MSGRVFAALAACLTLALGAPAAGARPRTPAPPAAPGPPEELPVEGSAPAYYYPPKSTSRQRPVLVYLHGRGGRPEDDCRKWARVAREFGWLLCPSGQEDRGGGARGWGNNWVAAQAAVDRALAAFHKKAGRRAQTRGNTLIGFSEGAYVAMNVGVREPQVFNRWLILAANTTYWGGEGEAELARSRAKLKRVYLLTGAQDEIVDSSRRVFDLLDRARVHVRLRVVDGLGHEIPEDRMVELYRRPLRWLADAR